MSSIATRLASVLRTVRRPGDFFVAGRTELFAPSLEVEGVGPVALPLLPTRARQFIAAADPAPSGRGAETVLDPAVKRAASSSATAAPGRPPSMSATLVAAPPSSFAGGGLVVRHRNREVRLDLACWLGRPARHRLPRPCEAEAEGRMAIDIDRLTEAELIDLNRRVVERLRLLQQMRAHQRMLEFRIGDRVAFQADGRGAVEGMLTRYNRKSVTVITDDGHQWNVAPGLLTRAAAGPRARPNLVRLK